MGLGDVRRPAAADDGRQPAAVDPRSRHRHGLPGPDVVAESRRADRAAGDRGAGRHRDMPKPAPRRPAARKRRYPDPDRRLREYLHQLSSGMRQRLDCDGLGVCRGSGSPTSPRRPSTSRSRRRSSNCSRTASADLGTALVMITHDLGVIAGQRPRQRHVQAGSSSPRRGTSCSLSRVTRTPGAVGIDSLPGCAARGEASTDPRVAERHPALAARLRVRTSRCGNRIEVCTQETPTSNWTAWTTCCGASTRWRSTATGASPRPDDRRNVLLEVAASMYFLIRSGVFVDRQVGTVRAVDEVDLTCRAARRTAWSGSQDAASPPSDAGCSVSSNRPGGNDLLDGIAVRELAGGGLARRSRRRMQMIFRTRWRA